MKTHSASLGKVERESSTPIARKMMIVTAASPTSSGIDLIRSHRSYCEAWGMRVHDPDEGAGVRLLIDYSVVRLSLQGASETLPERVRLFAENRNVSSALSASQMLDIRDSARYLATRAKARTNHQNPRARFINVAGGTQAEMLEEVKVWQHAGFECEVQSGPYFRSTRQAGGRRLCPTHMPYSTCSWGKTISDLLTRAWEVRRREPGAEIPDLEPGQSPIWASHSLRRGATKLALRLIKEKKSNADEELIDRHFRWKTAEMDKSMQKHYAGLQGLLRRLSVTLNF
jgi:hypothetical protein